MARYVVVEFAGNEDAEAFIQQLNEENRYRRDDRLPFMRRVVGIFVKPGKTCECSDRRRANYGDKNWAQYARIARGERFGWWVCSRCNKPREGGHQLVNQINMSDTYEGTIFNDYEFCVTGLDVTGIHTSQVDRPKKLRRKKAKNG